MNFEGKSMQKLSPLKRALDLSTNKFVSACAGAGKTYTLSKRYCKILDEFTKQNIGKPKHEWSGTKNILVITFTKKAAAEMAGRIYQDLKILINGNVIKDLQEQGIQLGENIINSSDEYKRWLRSTFSENHISTIDGFCTKILRENASKVELDPKFKVSDEIQSAQIFNITLDEFLQQKSNDFDEELRYILKKLTVNKIKQNIKYLHNNRAFVRDWFEFINENNEEEIEQKWTADYCIDADYEYLKTSINKVLTYAPFYNAAENNKGKQIFDNLKILAKQINSSVTIEEEKRITIADILPLFQTGAGTYLKSITSWKKDFWTEPKVYNEFRELIKDFCNYLRENISETEILKIPNKYDFLAIPVLKRLVKFYQEFFLLLRQRQAELNCINFDDIIVLTHELLSKHDNIRAKYSKQFRHIMLDEFQDTNDVRWEIIQFISRKEHENTLRKSGLFIVGDKKQSIYRFNQADVEVMNRAEKELTEHADIEKVVIKFNDNFRSSQSFIQNVINRLFPQIMPKSDNPYEAEFEPTTYNPNNKSKADIAENTEYVCNVQAVLTEQDTTNEQKKHLSALNAAAMVKDMLLWADETGIDSTPVIGVLLRKFSNIQNYLKVFQEQKIPFEILGGRGLFQQQEAYDLFHLVSVLLNPFDDIALIGLLRSPFFAASDKLINGISKRIHKQSVFSFITSSEEFEEIVQPIEEWRTDAKFLPIDVLISKILSTGFTKLGYFSEIGGRQRISNIYKIINIIREFSLEGSSLQNLYEFLLFQAEENKTTPQAENPNSAKVQILSIHKSKGLEFPAVIMPEMSSVSKSDSSSVSHGRMNIDGRIEMGISLTEEGECKKMHFLEAIKQQSKAEEAAENKRLFYVAVTRAKYRVAFLAEITEKPGNSKNFWNEYIKPCYGLPAETDPQTWEKLQFEKTKTTLLLQEQLSLAQTEKEAAHKSWTEPAIQAVNNFVKKLTPHDLMEESHFEVFEKTDDYKPSEFALMFGTVYHKIMEEEWWENDNFNAFAEEYSNIAFPLIPFKNIEEEMSRQVNNFKSSELFPILPQIPINYKFPELPVIGCFQRENDKIQVSGIIDLLYKYNENWFVLDYKTDRTLDNAEKYKIQVQAYLQIVKQLYGITAEGQIYFSAINILFSIEFDTNYATHITVNEKYSNENLNSLKTIVKSHFNNKILIINQTMQQRNSQIKFLAAHNVLTPNVQFITLNQLIKQNAVTGKKLSKSAATLLIKKLTENSEFTSGQIELLADAILKNEKYSVGIDRDYLHIEEGFAGTKKFENYVTEADEIKNFSINFSNTIILLNGFYKEMPIEFNLMKKISKSAKKFYFINNFGEGKIESTFDIEYTDWETTGVLSQKNQQQCVLCFSVQEEVERVAQEISELLTKGKNTETIKVAVSSMERYIPAVNTIFDDYGIPFYSSQKVSILRFPVVQLILDFLKMFGKNKLRWEDVFAVILNPVYKPTNQLYLLNHYLRNNGVHFYKQNVIFSSKDTEIEEIYNSVRELWCSVLNKIQLKDVLEIIRTFTKKKDLKEKLKEDKTSIAVLDLFLLESEIFVQLYSSFEIKFDTKEFIKDLIKHLLAVEVPLKTNKEGIEIIGLLDTLNRPLDNLFVLGFVEGDFPIITTPNPLLNKIPNNKWSISLLLMNYWKTLNEKVRFFVPLRDLDGSDLQPSTFTEFLDVMNFSDLPGSESKRYSKTAHFAGFYQKQIISDTEKEAFIRHNKLLSTEFNEFKGKTEKSETNNIIMSATKMDNLLNCPMKYWFSSKLNIKPIEFNEMLTKSGEKGDIVHKALELFGKTAGFHLNRQDIKKGCVKLADNLAAALNSQNINPDKNLLQQHFYSTLRDGLKDGYASNLFVKLLNWNREKLSNFDEGLFEQKFGMTEFDVDSWEYFSLSNEVLQLNFRGKIDKVLINEIAKIIYVTDYKTGTESKPKDITEMYSSQMVIYCLVLGDIFPDYKIFIAYEKLKSLKPNEIGLTIFFEKETGSDLLVLNRNNSLSLEATKTLYLAAAKKITEGEFPVAEKSRQQKACNFCDYKMICRKSTYQ